MKKLFKQNIYYVLGAIVGGLAGFFYWRYVGCYSGYCMITSKPFNSIIYFAILGSLMIGLLGSVIQQYFKKNIKTD